MFNRLKFSASALLGLALGICLALPLFWIGVKRGVGELRDGAQSAFGAVELRQQNMADEALRLEVSLKNAKVRLPSVEDFAKVELLRSQLAGSGNFEDKIEISQELERALVNVETLFSQTMAKNPKAAASAFCRDFGLNWQPMKRYLVDEEYHFSNAVRAYNSVLASSPVPFVVGHRTFSSLLSALVREARERAGLYLKQALLWAKFAPRWLWAKISNASVMPEKPQPMAPTPYTPDALYAPLPEPFYIAQAPVPEEDYPELQYDRTAPAMADVEVGQQKAVLENGTVAPYAAPVPTIQRTATYR
jgi:hypothetical protein